MVFVEDPWSRIVAVHWQDDGPPPTPDLGPPYCSRYGYGAIVADIGTLITAVPYGPNQLPPMFGTFPTSSKTGGISQPLMHPTSTLTAAPYGLVATNILLGANTMQFTNNQLLSLQDAGGGFGSIGWVEVMAAGQTASGSIPNVGVPIVIKSYAIEMEWASTWLDPSDEVGLGISHLMPAPPGVTVPAPPPPEPAVVFGSRAGGSGSYFYDFKYAEWARGDIHVNAGNQFDPELGGPALLWWMTRHAGGGAWSGSGQFMVGTILGLGDHYTWEIVATCQPEPPL